MPRLIIQVRTRNNLSDLLAKGESPAWVVAKKREAQITNVQVVSFEGTQMIEGGYDRAGSRRQADGRLIIRFFDGRIANCSIVFQGQNPVHYITRPYFNDDDMADAIGVVTKHTAGA